jgi:hypothetical protein
MTGLNYKYVSLLSFLKSQSISVSHSILQQQVLLSVRDVGEQNMSLIYIISEKQMSQYDSERRERQVVLWRQDRKGPGSLPNPLI